MKLIDAYNLLAEDGVADNHRYFAEVYKQFQFRDDDTLKDYVDFILHEPVHWMRGFPAKLTSKTAFSKPKTAVIKLLKKTAVMEDLGVEYAAEAQATVWDTYKIHHEEILKERGGCEPVVEAVASVVITAIPSTDSNGDAESDIDSYESVPVPTPMPRMKVMHIKHPVSPIQPTAPTSSPSSHSSHPSHSSPTFDPESDRVEILKQVIYHLLETVPDGVSDAFRLLVERV